MSQQQSAKARAAADPWRLRPAQRRPRTCSNSSSASSPGSPSEVISNAPLLLHSPLPSLQSCTKQRKLISGRV